MNASHAEMTSQVAGLTHASEDVQQLHRWIVATADHRALPFLVIDKIQATVHVFDAQAHWVDSAPALLGAARGDTSAAHIGERALSAIRPFEKTTPAGRFESFLDYNLAGDLVLWVDYASAVSLHPLRSTNPQEHRHERLSSPTPVDNRISFGCINVWPAFFEEVITPAFARQQGVVYVLPETKTWPSVFIKSRAEHKKPLDEIAH